MNALLVESHRAGKFEEHREKMICRTIIPAWNLAFPTRMPASIVLTYMPSPSPERRQVDLHYELTDRLFTGLNRWRGLLPGTLSFVVPSQKRLSL